MFYDRFVELCSVHGVSPSKAAQEAGINKSTVTYWKNHAESKPTGQLAEKLCSYFNVSMNELYGDTQKETPTENSEPLKIGGTYLRLAQKAQELDLDDEDVDAILSILSKHKKKNL